MPTDRIEAPGWAPPLLAVQFLTRVPTPWLSRLTPNQARDGLARATGWLPLVGATIGLATGLIFVAAAHLWPPMLAAAIALAFEAWLTGAFHEDAVADFCDGFGGARSGDEVRRIMKDSRIGSYGAVGLVLAVALRLFATAALPLALALPAIVAAATMARLWAVVLMAIVPPAPLNETGGSGLAKDIGALPPGMLAFACLLAVPGLTGFAALAPLKLALTALVGLVFLPAMARLLMRRIGGTTGDCLGFAAYVGQVTLLLFAAAR